MIQGQFIVNSLCSKLIRNSDHYMKSRDWGWFLGECSNRNAGNCLGEIPKSWQLLFHSKFHVETACLATQLKYKLIVSSVFKIVWNHFISRSLDSDNEFLWDIMLASLYIMQNIYHDSLVCSSVTKCINKLNKLKHPTSQPVTYFVCVALASKV